MATQPPPVPANAPSPFGQEPARLPGATSTSLGGAADSTPTPLGKVEGPRIAVADGDVALAAEAAPIETISFWQQPFAQNILPLLTSLILHLTFIGMILLLIPIKDIIMPREREQIIVPDADMVMDGAEGGIPHPGLGGDPTRDAFQDTVPDVPKDSKGLADKAGPTLQVSLMGGGENDSSSSIPIGIGVGGFGKGTRVGSGTGDGTGQLAPFGIPGGGGGLGPKSNFIGLGGNARRVAYVCDASGSMMSMFDSLRVEIRKSVDGLKPVQSFDVLFFKEDSCTAMDKTALRMATPDNKRQAGAFLEGVNASGSTDPIPALKLAFSLKPDLIYLLTDGDFQGPGNEAVVKFCRDQTIDGKVKINTIAFIAHEKDNAQDLEFVKALQAIAKNSGGQFKNVSDEDMGGK